MKRNKKILVKKYNGKYEPFSEFKLERSLKRVGSSPKVAKEIVKIIKVGLRDGTRTSQIHDQALNLLSQKRAPLSARYNLKQALLALGPSGHTFENFIGEFLKAKGYSVELRQMVMGKCVMHEVDVVARKGQEHVLVEAKFHNHPGFKTDIKTALYVKARFDDIVKSKLRKPHFHKAILITNTKFTQDAIAYAECEGLELIGWNYPAKGSLQEIIETSGLLPVTSLSSLSLVQQRDLLKNGFVLCHDLVNNPMSMKIINATNLQENIILDEASKVCKIK